MSTWPVCPTCGSSHVVGVEVLGDYDGVLYLRCLAGHRFHRFPEGHWLRERAEKYIRTIHLPTTGSARACEHGKNNSLDRKTSKMLESPEDASGS